MHNPDVQAQFGIGPLKDKFDPNHCKKIYRAIWLVLKSFGRLVWKWHEQANVAHQNNEQCHCRQVEWPRKMALAFPRKIMRISIRFGGYVG